MCGTGADDIGSDFSAAPVVCRRSFGVLGDEGGSCIAGGEFTLSAQEMKMGLCWMLIILLGCKSLLGTQLPSTCDCDDMPEVQFIPANDGVRVPCPNVTGEELTYELRKGQQAIYNYTCTNKENSQKCKSLNDRQDVEPFNNKGNKFAGFLLTKGTSEITGIYSCIAKKIFLPPVIKECAQRILVLDGGCRFQSSQHNCSNVTTERQDPRETQGYPWIWITVVALLGAYSLTVTILALVNWMKLKKTDSQSDYMNTKPRAARGNKNRGIQNPFPKYF